MYFVSCKEAVNLCSGLMKLEIFLANKGCIINIMQPLDNRLQHTSLYLLNTIIAYLISILGLVNFSVNLSIDQDAER